VVEEAEPTDRRVMLGAAKRRTHMNLSQLVTGSLIAAAVAATPIAALADDAAHSTVGVGGYDLVTYQTGKKPLPGNGNYLTVHDGVTYLFVSEANKVAFDAAPTKYLPAYGGWCAFGVSVGKKFVGDPNVWEVVDGRLYLNLDNSIKTMWLGDVHGNIAKAEKNWPKIRNTDPAKL
jgi:YHS domain-containing protein